MSIPFGNCFSESRNASAFDSVVEVSTIDLLSPVSLYSAASSKLLDLDSARIIRELYMCVCVCVCLCAEIDFLSRRVIEVFVDFKIGWILKKEPFFCFSVSFKPF